jgi:hypothetical protein
MGPLQLNMLQNDGCHANSTGKDFMGQQLQEFINAISSASSQAM